MASRWAKTVSCLIILPEDHPDNREAPKTRVRHNGDVLEGYLEIVTEIPLDSDVQLLFEGIPIQSLEHFLREGLITASRVQ